MIAFSHISEDLEIFEFQGEFENMDLFDGQFDKEKLQMRFKGFTLQGKKVKKDFTIVEKVESSFIRRKVVQEVILFNQPPKFNF